MEIFYVWKPIFWIGNPLHQTVRHALRNMSEQLTYIQVGRYETQKSAPSSDVLQKLAKALDTTTDFLMLGSQDEVVSAQLADKELLKLLKQVEQLRPEDKHLVKTFIDAFITKRQVQELAK